MVILIHAHLCAAAAYNHPRDPLCNCGLRSNLEARDRALTEHFLGEAARIVDALATGPLTEWERAEAIREVARRMAGA